MFSILIHISDKKIFVNIVLSFVENISNPDFFLYSADPYRPYPCNVSVRNPHLNFD